MVCKTLQSKSVKRKETIIFRVLSTQILNSFSLTYAVISDEVEAMKMIGRIELAIGFTILGLLNTLIIFWAISNIMSVLLMHYGKGRKKSRGYLIPFFTLRVIDLCFFW